MNPVLSSTIDFDNYLQRRVDHSRAQRESIAKGQAVPRAKSPAVPVARTRPSPSSTSSASSSAAATANGRLSVRTDRMRGTPVNTNVNGIANGNANVPLEVTASRYEVSRGESRPQRPTSARRERETERETKRAREAKRETERETVEIVHSWRQYVRPARPAVSRSPSPPRVFVPSASASVSVAATQRNTPSHVQNSTISRWRTENDEEASPSASPFLHVQRRVKTLSRAFSAWRAQAAAEARVHDKLSRLLSAQTERALQQFVMRSWFFAAIAHKQELRKMKRKKRIAFLLWNKRAFVSIRRKTIADRFRYAWLLLKGMRRLRALLLTSARRDHHKQNTLNAYRHRVRSLLRKTFFAWKTDWQAVRREKQIKSEQDERQNKIHAFLQRIEQRPVVSRREKEREREREEAAARRQRSRSASRGTVRIAAADSKPIEVEQQREREKPRNRTLQRPPLTHTENRRTRGTESDSEAAREKDRHKEEEKGSQGDSLWDIDVDSESVHDMLPPPPSYRHFAHSGTENRQSVKEREKESFSMAEVSRAVEDISSRELTRKEKIALLRQQAMERVHQRQREEENKLKEKMAKESAEAERLREEARRKLEEEKQKSARSLAQLEEQKRKAKKADDFRRKSLLVRFGLSPWNRYMDIVWKQSQIADHFHRRKALQNYWQMLSSYAVAVKTQRVRSEYRKTLIATAFHKQQLLRRTVRAWRVYRYGLKAKAMVAAGIGSKKSVLGRAFRGWRIAQERAQREALRALRAVSGRGDRAQARHYFRLWCDFVSERRIDREIARRAERKWRDVQSWMHK